MWNELLDSQNNQNQDYKLLVIDTEGFGSTDKDSDETRDRNIFIMASLLSSYMVFNTNENITESSITTFQLITGLANQLVK